MTATDATSNTPIGKPTPPSFVKTNIPNLIKLEPAETYYGRCKFRGKLVRQSLETKDFKVTKSKILKWLMEVRGRVYAHEGHMGSLIEECQRRLRLEVDKGSNPRPLRIRSARFLSKKNFTLPAIAHISTASCTAFRLI